ncbi:Gfo/Idh/MocA family protein [Amycolatopsis vancoresmycina]|uniref:Oxidoreductase domain-containing protein n=1 Tax=Amycolatopsis vancoresmycina DSM 44592 TaxID=1292037 RepID=R1G4E1_9PSEU|nr:Gfo/Idh/MocA family oxidoreductase [Amycolatopsis vancoresmycina]EOD66348.1 oxidoreductase domain-containing protein [Amycolatopsis vancoresmycina DSM 44592]
MIRVGLVGLGVIGAFYRAAIAARPDMHLAAVCDLRPELLDDPVACYTDHRRMCTEAGLDAVVVTVPNDAHAAVCRDALAAGLAVCVEKPLATTLSDAVDLERLARAVGRPLFTAFHRRYNDNLLALRAAVDVPVRHVTVRYLERIEDHVGVDAWYLDPVRCGGGCVADNGPNAFDLVRLFLGDVTVTDVEITRDGGVDRQAVVALRASCGATARVELDWSFPGEVKDVRVASADGTVRYADLLAGHPGFKQSLNHEYRGVAAEFARLLRTGAVVAGDGLAALELVESCYRAESRVSRA